jgi:integrase
MAIKDYLANRRLKRSNMPEKKNKLNNIKIKSPEKFSEDFNNLKNITLSILGKMKDTAETRTLNEKLQKCDDIVELLEIATKISYKALIHISENKYLTEDEAESLKAACETSEEQSVVRDMLDTGMRLDEAIKRKKQYPKYL